MKHDRLIEKMRKLLAMARGGANENESATAMRQLHSMLAKHNISMAEIDQSPEDIGFEEIMLDSRPWRKQVASAVAKLYFCRVVWVNYERKAKYKFYGTESNRIFAASIFEMVIKTIEKEARVQSKALYGGNNCGFVNSFWSAAADRVVVRCGNLMTESMKGEALDEEGNKLPALLNEYEQMWARLKDFEMEHLSNVKSVALNTRITNAEGHSRGHATGNKVQLSRTLKKSAARLTHQQ